MLFGKILDGRCKKDRREKRKKDREAWMWDIVVIVVIIPHRME